MTWTKLSDNWNSHPKMLKLTRNARLFWVDCLTYCNEHGTDGDIPTVAIKRIAGDLSRHCTNDCVKGLVDAGLLEKKADGSGYAIHDFLEFNPSRSQLEEKRESTKKRVEASRLKSQIGPDSVPNVSQIGPDSVPNVSRPNQITSGIIVQSGACNAVTTTLQPNHCNTAPVPSRPVPSRPSSEEILRAPLELAEVPPEKAKTPYQQICDVYFTEYKRVRGKAPPFGKRDGKAVNDLLKALNSDHVRVIAAIRKAFLDPFWADKATICAINADPGRFDGGLFGTLPAQARPKNAYPVQGGSGGVEYLESLRLKREANALLPDEPVLECVDV